MQPRHSENVSPIRERTRHAIAQHRARRQPDLRRTYAGTSAPARSSSRQPKQQQQPENYRTSSPNNSSSSSSHLPVAESEAIYQDIEAEQQQREPHRRKSAGVDRQQRFSSSVEDHLHHLERSITSTGTPSPESDRKNMPEDRHRARTVRNIILQPPEERATYSASRNFVHSGRYETHAAKAQRYAAALHAYDYQPPEPASVQQQNQQQPIVYRDDGSVMTGMSQQELIRKKTRTLRRKERRFGSKPKNKPILQLPANLLQPMRISTPQQHFYVQQTSRDEKSRRSLWSKSRSSQEEEAEQESSSTTAEITSASWESPPPLQPLPNRSAPILGSFAAAPVIIPTSGPPVLAVRGDDTFLGDSTERSLGDMSFPVLSQKAWLEDQVEVEERDTWRVAQDPQKDTTRNVSSSNDASNSESTSSTERRGVRFAEVIDDFSDVPWDQKEDQKVADDSSEVPWDQKTDLRPECSPSSVLENIQEGVEERNTTLGAPKSILRSSRFKPNPTVAMRYYGSERRVLDFESERLIYAGGDDCYRNRDGDDNYMLSEPRAMIGGGRRVATQANMSDRLDQRESSLPTARLANSREVNSALEMSPPRTTTGFMDKEGFELSPIQPDSKKPTSLADSIPISYIPGHPAEKHLREKMNTFREMRGGEIADRVLEEEQFPDPSFELDMDDDDTVMSAYMFIETVAAIVIQTAVRQFLATLYADSLRQTRDAKDLVDRIDLIEKSCVEQTLHVSREVNYDYEDSEWSCPIKDPQVAHPSITPEGDFDDVDTFPINDLQEAHPSIESEGDLDDMALNLFGLAAIQIQAVYRGFWVRDCLDVDHYCTTVLQRAYRRFSCRMKFYRDMERIILVQSWWRRNIARDEAAHILAYAIFIQAVFRGHRVRKRYRRFRKEETHRKSVAATIVQSRWRAFICEARFIRTLVDLLIAQTVVRRWLAHKRMAMVRKEWHATERLCAADGQPNRNMSRRDDKHTRQDDGARYESAFAKETVDQIGATSRKTGNREPTKSVGVDVSPRGGPLKQQNRHKAPLQISKPTYKLIAQPRNAATSSVVVQADAIEMSDPSRLKVPEERMTASTETRRKTSSMADPPGFRVNKTSSGGQRQCGSEGSVPAAKSSTIKDRELPRSKVVAYPILDIEEQQKGGSLPRCITANEDARHHADAKSRDADFKAGEPGLSQDTQSDSNSANKVVATSVLPQASVSEPRADIPISGATNSLLSMWKDKEKKNSFASRNLR